MAVIPSLNSAGGRPDIIGQVAAAQSMMHRAQQNRILQERHEMNKQKFGAELLTLDMQQQREAINLQVARNTLAENEAGLKARMIQLKNQENTLVHHSTAMELESQTADKARRDYDLLMQTVQNPQVDPITREGMIAQWTTMYGGLADSEYNPAFRKEFGAKLAKAAGYNGALRLEYGQQILRSASKLTSRLTGVQTRAELFALMDDDDFAYASRDENFAKQVDEAQKRIHEVELANIKAKNNTTKIPSESMKRFTSIVSVADSLDRIENMFDDVGWTGPLLGYLRSKNPYDKTAQQLKTYVESTIPGLARGVFGEVGVLTDTDVERYSRALPKLTSTKELADMVLADLRDRLNSQWKRNVEVFGAAGYDTEGLSGFMEKRNAEVRGETDEVGPNGI